MGVHVDYLERSLKAVFLFHFVEFLHEMTLKATGGAVS